LTRIIGNLAQQEYAIPGSFKRYFAEKTIQTWYYAWRRDGIDGLVPKPRSDRGQSKLSPDVQAAILRAKQENPKRSIAQIIELVHTTEQVDPGILNKSNVHRLLQAHNLSHNASAIDEKINSKFEVFNDFSRHASSREDMPVSYRWMLDLLQCQYDEIELEAELGGAIANPEIEQLLHHIREGPLLLRNRAVTVFANIKNIPRIEIAHFLGLTPKQVDYILRLFNTSRMIGLFGPKKRSPGKWDDAECKNAVFALLHSPPMEHDVNRTTWTLKTLSAVLEKTGFPVGKGTIAKIIKNAGFRFRKAKRVLTSTDPEYKTKLHEITSILAKLKPDEKFFSIDEYGPFSVKMQGGTSLAKTDQLRVVPQYQKSKGCLIVTAALELSENQITHFYSKYKNTEEIIKLIEILMAKYSNQSHLYFSWDSASWHASEKLYNRIEEINSEEYQATNKTPLITLAPLPSCAQFLNVIESVFSGMAKAIIHNSDYQSVEECSSAIDRYFCERNAHFRSCPSRAGKKIWGKERVPCEFSESNNCKDPLYR
jgi:transposase